MEKTITFYLKYAKTVKIIFILTAIVAVILGLVLMEDSDGISVIIGFVTAGVFVGTGIVLENNFKWKAYMLKCSYDISKSKNY